MNFKMIVIKQLTVIAFAAVFGVLFTVCDNGTDEPNRTPVADDFNIGNLIQAVGSVNAVTITPKAGKSTGAITIYYGGSTTLPAVIGTYHVTFDVSAAPGWNAVNGLFGGTLAIDNQTPVTSDFNIGNLTQTVENVSAVTITPKAGKSTGAITIYYNGSTTLPEAAGAYIVTFDVAAVIGWYAASGLVGGTLVINQNPVADDFEIGNLTQVLGSVTPVTITPKEGKSTGGITIYYDGSTTLPEEPGSYIVTFDIAAIPGWYAANSLHGGILFIVETTGIVIGDPLIKLYMDDNPLANVGTTTLSQEEEFINISIDPAITTQYIDSYSNIIWYVNGHIATQGASKTSIMLSTQVPGIYQVAVYAATSSGVIKSGSHNFIIRKEGDNE